MFDTPRADVTKCPAREGTNIPLPAADARRTVTDALSPPNGSPLLI